ncbi:reverse transcriptase domain-containing protein [Tanacetum coccineum]
MNDKGIGLERRLFEKFIELGSKSQRLSGMPPVNRFLDRLVDLYCKCGRLVDARKVFDKMWDKDVAVWNAMVARTKMWDKVRSHHQNSGEAGMSKDISGSELLASSYCSGIKRQSDKAQVAHVNLPQHLAPSVGLGILIYPKKKTKEGMVDSQPMEEEIWGTDARGVGTETHGEHDQQAKTKAMPRRLAYADSDKEALVKSLAKGFSDRLSLESSGTSETQTNSLRQ